MIWSNLATAVSSLGVNDQEGQAGKHTAKRRAGATGGNREPGELCPNRVQEARVLQ